jgi:4-hydroxythreonine-4-phosphate dehydrogenase
MGEPAGIAPDITLAAWQTLRGRGAPFLVIGDPDLLASRARLLGIAAPVEVISTPASAIEVFRLALPVVPEPLGSEPAPGSPDPAVAQAVVRSIERAVELALAGAVAGVVTNPIQKETLYRAGFRHQGHTDFLAHLAREQGHEAEPVMMLSAGELRTVPLTVHVPLKDVPRSVTADLILRQARTIAWELKGLIGREQVRIAVAGLNPHAGENGTIGTEEARIIAPAVARLREEGLEITGPLSADSLFHEEVRGRYDAYLCMYHDQALIPVKTVGFHEGVNTTLGLPFVRTSPDHGTALGLAGKGAANPSSLVAAIDLAGRLAEARARSTLA